MSVVTQPVCEFGKQANDFSLEGVDGKTYSLADIKGKNGTLVMFICNHCPFVKASIDRIVRDVEALKPFGIGAVAIMANDTVNYPEDDLEHMKKFARQHGFGFPYLIDKTQEVAKAYGAVCTPDFFGFNSDLRLQYRGRLDPYRPGEQEKAGTPRELVEAMKQIAKTGRGPDDQKPSMGCSIKWK